MLKNRLSRREFVVYSAAAALAAGSSTTQSVRAAAQHDAGAARKPNFVFILCDDLGYGDLACFGHPRIQSPNLDRLASEGIRLTDCYAAAPVCSPARAGAMTGRNPYRCRIPDWIPENSDICLKPQEVTVAELLKNAGYATGFAGKWHLTGKMDGSQPLPGMQGFDHWMATQNNAQPSHHNPVNFVRNGEPVGKMEGYSSTIIVNEAIDYLRGRYENPFALFVWFHSPHEPVATDPQFSGIYGDIAEATKREYFGNVTQMDHEVGRLLAALDEFGMRDDTFVMFTSDNGPETLNRYKNASHSHGSPGPLRGMKLHMYEGGIRVPGMVRWPGHTLAGTESSEPVCGVDLLPTLCALGGVAAPTDRALDGADVAPIFDGGTVARTQPLYWRYDRALSEMKHAMRDGDWKILADAKLERFELYNLRADLAEENDLAAAEPDRARAMSEALLAIHDSVETDPISAPAEGI